MNIIGKRKLYFTLSLLVLIPGFIALLLWGLRLSIDFTGGSRVEFQILGKTSSISNQQIQQIIEEKNIEVGSVQKSGNNQFIVRVKPLSQKENSAFSQALENKYESVKFLNFETVGPVVGVETATNAVKAIIVACFLIVLYIAWSFRKAPKPASSWRFGICAVIALFHDVLVVVGVFALLGFFFHVEVDSLFVTALLTIIGFSVHDTIVVFDRIRENLRRMAGVPFEAVVNESIVQTLGRSLNTSFTVILVLTALLLFGGESIQWFVVALLVGILSGTYSSIFNAAPLLVVWQEWSDRRRRAKT